jgi:anhydro-N-acetylmuramic acid kinase
LFRLDWLSDKLKGFGTLAPRDVQATLAALTATTLADAIAAHAPSAQFVYICGGGAYNTHLMQQLEAALSAHNLKAAIDSTAALGISPNHVEALAFAWLAHRFEQRRPGNLPTVTGAAGERILGALYPA